MALRRKAIWAVGLTVVLVLAVGATLLVRCSVGSDDAEEVASTSVSEQEGESASEYWTEERRRDAEPAEMPDPDEQCSLPSCLCV